MKISVAICTYNGEKYIAEQLHSILHQHHPVDEIIICDDGSSDNTRTICKAVLSDSTINYQIIENEVPLHVVGNFHKCYSLCTGDIIFSSDQDDIWLPNKTEKIVEVFKSNQQINLVASNALLIDKNSNSKNQRLRDIVNFEVPNDYNDWIQNVLRGHCITGATMAVRKEFSDQYFYQSKRWLHDGWLALIAALQNSLYYIDEDLIQYRIHDNNACGIGDFNVVSTGLKKPLYFHQLAKEKHDDYHEIVSVIQTNSWNITQKNQQMIEECIEFWDARSHLNKMSLKECRMMTKRFKKEGHYTNYTKSNSYFWLDRYFWLIYHIFPNKVRDN